MRRRVGKGWLAVSTTALVVGGILGTGSALAVGEQKADVHVDKVAVRDTIAAGETATFRITVSNDGTLTAKGVTLNDRLPDGGLNWYEDPDDPKCTITEDPAGDLLVCDIGLLDPGQSFTVTVSAATDADDCGLLENTASVTAINEELEHPLDNTDSATIRVVCDVPGGGTQGCTPGYWKNHPEVWDGAGTDDVVTRFRTTDLFNATFGVTATQSGVADTVTLLQALSLGGGSPSRLNLARHAVAGILSGDSSIDYSMTADQVIALYRDAVGAAPGPETVESAHAKLEAANERECPF